MAESKSPDESRVVSENPKVSVVGEHVVRIEFTVEELVNQLTSRIPSRVMVANCSGCNGCSA